MRTPVVAGDDPVPGLHEKDLAPTHLENPPAAGLQPGNISCIDPVRHVILFKKVIALLNVTDVVDLRKIFLYK
jgi:hypothetical protein